ncbi:hypothetical protein BHAOGJBA_1169 [Methylobacterium hispanicum]|uniref:Uncharacterized protein n=1 Tax=Methylobacterium hispanicum TaxID=270350 RepID=A0AAV4ZGU9_9HYPH|nr:hypothetical protein [Methylobacterium hispanicum]GJD87664.1 hypothetical protein BHAOGJBA_1169 [Methylobacterium hispanicum]
MGFSNKGGIEADADEAERRAREFRISLQQFLNQNAAIFSAMARRGIGTGDRDFYDHAARIGETARDVAMLVVAMMEDVPPQRASEQAIRMIRPDVVEYVVERWLGFDAPVDATLEARAIVAVLRLADGRFDFSPYGRGAQASPNVSVALTFVAASSLMACQTLPYDFRAADPAALQRRLLEAVVDAAQENLPRMVVEECPEAEARTVLQSLVKHFSRLMRAVYERETDLMVQRAAAMDEVARQRWFETRDPVADIVKDFRERASHLVAMGTALAAKSAKSPTGEQPQAA